MLCVSVMKLASFYDRRVKQFVIGQSQVMWMGPHTIITIIIIVIIIIDFGRAGGFTHTHMSFALMTWPNIS